MLNEETGLYYGKKGRIIRLTFTEAIVLSTLIKYKNETVTYKTLLKECWNEDRDNTQLRRNIIVVIHKLRKKLRGEFKIFTRNSFGYILK